MIGLSLLVGADIICVAGTFLADYSASHILNPRWPPHAKFHNGQTMTLSALLSSASLYLVFRHSLTTRERLHDLFMAAVIGSLYCGAGLAAILYPGTAWMDPEFKSDVPDPQKYIFSAIIAMAWCGYFLERNGLKTAIDKIK